jgi:hypothetical protein
VVVLTHVAAPDLSGATLLFAGIDQFVRRARYRTITTGLPPNFFIYQIVGRYPGARLCQGIDY